MNAVILSIGDELVLGQTVDTNSAYLSTRLTERGIAPLYHQTIPDDRSATAEAIRQAAAAAPLVIVTGGLGPTEDDLTRQGLADAMGEPLVEDAASATAIAAFFERLGRTMPQANRVQAMHPAGSEMIPNTCGTAPGIKATLGDATIYVVPGVPSEMTAMFDAVIGPQLDKLPASGRSVIRCTSIHSFGIGESDLAQRLVGLTDRDRNPLVGTTVSGGVVSVRVRSQYATVKQAERELAATVEQVERRLGSIVFGRDQTTLQDAVVHLLRDARATVATAESCTGGLIGKMLTDVAGSSDVYRGGWVTYANAMKTSQLGVPAEVLEADGAVSRGVVERMARAAQRISGSDYAIATTGIAGPGGGMLDKPVGTIWIALACPPADDTSDSVVSAWRLQFGGDRATIRDRTAKTALQILRLALLGADVRQISSIRSP